LLLIGRRNYDMENSRTILRDIPKVDELLFDEQLIFLMNGMPRTVVVDAVREIIGQVRTDILSGVKTSVPSKDCIIAEVCNQMKEKRRRSLGQLINATGVVLHTNFGRANLSHTVVEHVCRIASSYSNLEYDVKRGIRGTRDAHVEKLIQTITGAEAAIVVNNNAAATMLCLSALCYGKEVVVSRGELVEIGGSFRIPDIMKQSGAYLREVGATNKTKLSDYEQGYDPELTGAFMKVHTSNYRIMGFTQEVKIGEMAELGKALSVPVIYDMGSGLMVNLSHYGVDEPTVVDAINSGADVVLFSGDKLLGGPQGGVIIGKREYIEKMKQHPLARVLRVDKMTLAAMEATLYEYLDMEGARKKIPVLQMITVSEEQLLQKAKALKLCLEQDENKFTFETVKCEDQIGGGSAPMTKLPGYAVLAFREGVSAEHLERLLRNAEMPVIARVFHEKILLSVRTIGEDEFGAVAEAFSYVSVCLSGAEGA